MFNQMMPFQILRSTVSITSETIFKIIFFCLLEKHNVLHLFQSVVLEISWTDMSRISTGSNQI